MRLSSIIPRRVISLRVLPVSYRSCAFPTTDVPVVSVYIDMKSPHSYIALQVLPVQSFDSSEASQTRIGQHVSNTTLQPTQQLQTDYK